MRGGCLWTHLGKPRGWGPGRGSARERACGYDGHDAVPSRPKPRGGSMATISPRSRSTMACRACPVAPSRVVLGHSLEPGGVVVLQGDEVGDGLAPALRARPSLGGTAEADDGRAGMARPIAGLALGNGERFAALR